MQIALIILLVIFPAASFAAYQNPTVLAKAKQSDGTLIVTFSFAGDAGEPTVTRGYAITRSTTATAVRNWIDDTIVELELIDTATNIPALQINQTVQRLARVEPTPPPKRVWRNALHFYLQAKDSGLAAIATDLATLKTWLENNYQTGYLTE